MNLHSFVQRRGLGLGVSVLFVLMFIVQRYLWDSLWLLLIFVAAVFAWIASATRFGM
jgi:uncharacterized membrane protein YccC